MISPETLAELEERMGVEFNDKNLLLQALTHRSYLNENPKHPTGHYERLEFLGDAVLEFVVTDHLYRLLPEHTEGDLTNIRAALVQTATLTGAGEMLGISGTLLAGQGEHKTRQKDAKAWNYFMACCVEALLGAIYLDQGLGVARMFVDAFLLKNTKNAIQERHDYKSQLQEMAQKRFKLTPQYRVLSEEGPDHARVFRIACILGREQISVGTGSSKKEGQVSAARAALETISEWQGRISEPARNRPGSPVRRSNGRNG